MLLGSLGSDYHSLTDCVCTICDQHCTLVERAWPSPFLRVLADSSAPAMDAIVRLFLRRLFALVATALSLLEVASIVSFIIRCRVEASRVCKVRLANFSRRVRDAKFAKFLLANFSSHVSVLSEPARCYRSARTIGKNPRGDCMATVARPHACVGRRPRFAGGASAA